MNDEKKKNKINIIYAVLIVAIVLVAGITGAYAFFNMSNTDQSVTTKIVGSTDCIDIQFTATDGSEGNGVSLQYNYPISDEFALQNDNVTPVTVTIHNKCTNNLAPLDYSLILTNLSTTDEATEDSTYLPMNKVRVHVKKQKGESSTEEVLKNTDYLSTLKKLSKDSSTYKLLTEKLNTKDELTEYTYKTPLVVDTGKIENDETLTYKIYLWVDYYEGDAEAYNGSEHKTEFDNTTVNKSFKSLISLVVNNPDEDMIGGGYNYILKQNPRGLSTVVLGDMRRFVGTEGNVDNYVCFGYDNAETDCTNENSEYMYRIIGITPDGEIKLIRDDPFKSDMVQWNEYNDERCIDGSCTWPNSDIFKGLNGEYYLNTLSSTWSSKITNHNWWYGNIYENSYDDKIGITVSTTADQIYLMETGQKEVDQGWASDKTHPEPSVWPKNQKVTAKIGLMYLHDLYYANSFNYESGKFANCSGDYSTVERYCGGDGTTWINKEDLFKSPDWWVDDDFEWMMTSTGFKCYTSSSINESEYKCVEDLEYLGWPNDIHVKELTKSGYTRPVFYLDSSVGIKNGNGTADDPFIIEK